MHQILIGLALFLAAGTANAAEPAELSQGELTTNYYLAQAQQGSAYAQLTLGEIYYKGEVVDKDLVQAYAWLSVSARQDVPEAAELLAEVKGEMTDEQRAQGEAMAQGLTEQLRPPED